MLNILNKKGKIVLGTVIMSLALVCVFVGGNNQQAEAQGENVFTFSQVKELLTMQFDNQKDISINIDLEDIDSLFETLSGVLSPTEEVSVGSGTRYPSGLSADSTSPSAGEVRGATFTSTGAATFGGAVSATNGTFSGTLDVSGETVVEGFTQGGGVLSTTSPISAYTMTEAELLASNVFEINSTLAASTWTLPATSTMATLLATSGNTRSWLFHNATTSAGITLTIAAGSGIDLIGVTTGDDVIDETEYSELTCWRLFSTGAALDITCKITELLAAD
jgi:hypothetical protein